MRKRIAYRGLIVSDDLEMGAVLSAAPIGQAAVESIRAGSDLCLICHHENYITQAHEALVKAAESDRKFARLITESTRRVLAFKKKSAKLLHATKTPSAASVAKLSRRLWEFGEQVRLEALNREESARPRA